MTKCFLAHWHYSLPTRRPHIKDRWLDIRSQATVVSRGMVVVVCLEPGSGRHRIISGILSTGHNSRKQEHLKSISIGRGEVREKRGQGRKTQQQMLNVS